LALDPLGLAAFKAELASLTADIAEMLTLRARLAALELRVAKAQIQRLAIALGIAAVLGLTALPLLAVSAAHLLNGRLGISEAGWLVIMAAALLVTALLGAWLACRSFRGRFVGLEESLEELREDLLWLREWTQTPRNPAP